MSELVLERFFDRMLRMLFVCFAYSVNFFFLRNISLQASDIHRNENRVLWDLLFLYEINKVYRILEVRLCFCYWLKDVALMWSTNDEIRSVGPSHHSICLSDNLHTWSTVTFSR